MEPVLSRRDLGYTVISRLEETLRGYFGEKLPSLTADLSEQIPAGIRLKAQERSEDATLTSAQEFLEHLDFADLKEIAVYKGHYPLLLDPSRLPQSEFSAVMDHLYVLRCKIAHVRGFFTGVDLDHLIDSSRRVAECLGVWGEPYKAFLHDLTNHPERVVIPVPTTFFSDYFAGVTIPNNLPTPDYEYEGGFIGRDDDIRKVLQLLETDLHRVVTLSGAGGVGKTALALRVIQKLLGKAEIGFDGIVWLSAKETKLSVLGIENIEPTFRNYEQILDTIVEVMGHGLTQAPVEEKEKDVAAIFDLHRRVLVVIDNLETVSDQRIVNFILDAHPKSKFLITSRKGLGQVERRHELGQLKEKEAVHLFRQIARDKNLVKLAGLSEELIRSYVTRVACYPLAIKWLIGMAALGRDINTTVDSISETQSDISRFCFEAIYGSLSDGARSIICALSLFDEPPSGGVLKYVVDQGQQSFEDSVQELILVSLVVPEQSQDVNGEVITRYGLLSLTRGYVRTRLDTDLNLRRTLENRHHAVRSTQEEAARAKKRYQHSLEDLGASSEEEKVAALLANTAYQHYQSGRYSEAVDAYRRACEIAPRFSSIYRNWAVMESTEGHTLEAHELMEKATNLQPDNALLWKTWGDMMRKERRTSDALKYYQRASDLLPRDSAIMNALGQAKSRLGEYEEAERLIKRSLSEEFSPHSLKHRIIGLTSLADNAIFWAEALARDRSLAEAEKQLHYAMEACLQAIALDRTDERSHRQYRIAATKLGLFYKQLHWQKAIDAFEKAIVYQPLNVSEARDSIIAKYHIADTYFANGDLDKARQYCTKDLASRSQRLAPRFSGAIHSLAAKLHPAQVGESCAGCIERVEPARGFVIIRGENPSAPTFFGHVTDFVPPVTELSDNMVNRTVRFIPHTEQRADGPDRASAKYIQVT